MQLNALIGKKTYQKQGFLQDGRRIPLTAVNVLGNVVTQIKTSDKEGYNALQLGIDIKKKARKSLVEHSKKAGLTNTPAFFREVRMDDVNGATLGSEIKAEEVFQPGDIVDVTGISKGKGFAGGVKRWGFHGGPRTHGQSDRERAPGSIGQTTTPGRVYKGKKMAGRMGSDTTTVKNLEIIEITSDGVLLIKGLIPGSLNSVVVVKKIGTDKKFVPLYKEVEEQPTEEVQAQEQTTEPVKAEVKVESVEPLQKINPEPAVSSSGDGQAPVAEEISTPVNEPPAVAENPAPIDDKEDKKLSEAESGSAKAKSASGGEDKK